jgi:uncharacterized protein YndB with AHSA1/START domain
MENKNFSITFSVDQKPAEVFNAVKNVRAWWSEDLVGSSENVNDEFTYNHGDIHYSKHKLTEVILNHKIVWLTLDSKLTFVAKQNEWNGTEMIFQISAENGKTKLEITHFGLTPALQCYEGCNKGWTHYLQNSLLPLIEKGIGKPDKISLDNRTIAFQQNENTNQIIVTHAYSQSLETLWDAFTKTKTLEKWWAPVPFKAMVVENNFENNGKLFHYMLSPEGEKHYCIAEFSNIIPYNSYHVFDAFANENAVINTDLPRMKWQNSFTFQNGITTVTNTIQFETKEEIKQTIEMGFEQGYRMGLNQLYNLLNK